jgi:DNA-binding transcriptional LysR family regulator
MDLWQLHIFCKVVELKSFSKAGEAVRLSQPTVSSHIKELEAHFDTRLVDRLSRTIAPTDAGLLLYDYARRLMVLRDNTEAAMAEFSGGTKGRLNIGGSTIPGGYLLPSIIGRFTKRHSDVNVSLVVSDTFEIIKKTIAGHIELSLVGAPSTDKKIAQEPIIRDEMCLVIPAAHKWSQHNEISIEALIPEPFIVRETGSGTLRTIQEQLQKEHYSIGDFHVVAEMGSTEAVRQAVKSGMGLSILSRIAVAEDVQAGRVKTLHIQGLDLRRHFYLTTHRQRSLSPLSRMFVKFLKQDISTME